MHFQNHFLIIHSHENLNYTGDGTVFIELIYLSLFIQSILFIFLKNNKVLVLKLL